MGCCGLANHVGGLRKVFGALHAGNPQGDAAGRP